MKIKEIQQLLVLLLIAATTLSLFHVLRFNENPSLPIYDSYYHLNKIQSDDLKFNLLQETEYPLDIILAKSNNKIFFIRMLPFVTGLFNVYLLYLVFKELIKDKKQLFLTVLITLLSPVFIYTHSTYNSLFFPLLLVLLGTLFMLKDKYLLSAITLFAALIFNLNLFIVILFLLIIFYEQLKSKKIFFPIIGLIGSCYIFSTINNAAFPNSLSIYFLLTNYISDFGAIIGFGFFTLFLSAIGLYLSWNNKNENIIFYYALIALFVCSLYDNNLIIFIDLILIYYAGFALIKLWKSKWQSKILKNYVILLIICGLIFSAGSYLNEVSMVGPEQSEILSLSWLKDNFNADMNILSHYEYGYLIKTITESHIYTDKTYYLRSKDKLKIIKSNDIFQSRKLKDIKEFFDKEKIGYFWINNDMRQGQVWNKEEEGILLILENSQNFIKRYDYLDVQIWEYNSSRT